ncbi:MAG: glycosyltransferase [Dysgonamonadaceae bacterium]|jgi:glycosyltransferase involved in cell wall biosynthesis|nr:glycosyltransferase [Dysgonamonadaceae bacterium]
MDFSISSLLDFTLADWILGGTLLLFFLIQSLFYFFLYRKPCRYESKRVKNLISDNELPPVSVVIVCKNGAEDLAANLPLVLEQDYPDFEVVVVNSGSTDETDMALKGLEQQYKNLYNTYIPAEAKSINEKKLALTVGIKAAKNDILLFTEAYCKPSSNRWIREFAPPFLAGKDIVLGFCKLEIAKKTPMRKFMLYDNLIHGLKYLSMALVGLPYTGIGRNMAYRKKLFFENKGFSSFLNIDDGEDDLFLNRIAKRQNTGVAISPDSMTSTSTVDSFSTWRSLKSKYLYTKQFYKGFKSFLFGWESFSKYAFYLAVLCAVGLYFVVDSTLLIPALAVLLFFVRYAFQLSVINKESRLFEAGKYHVDLFFLDLFQPFNNLRFKCYANKRNRT